MIVNATRRRATLLGEPSCLACVWLSSLTDPGRTLSSAASSDKEKLGYGRAISDKMWFPLALRRSSLGNLAPNSALRLEVFGVYF